MLAYYGPVALLASLLFPASVQGIGVLFPLHVYPLENCAAWKGVNSAISAHSSTQWYIIINPDSGPGETDSLYQGCVASLASASNRITMGYLDTTSGHVESDIDKYAAWPANARPTGIYFDPVEPTADRLEMYTGWVDYAKSKGFSFIGLDPGTMVPDSYLALGDLVTTHESPYSSFDPDSLTGTLSKQSVNLEQAPSSGSYSAVIEKLQSKGVKAVYISNEPDTSQALPAQLDLFVSEVAAATESGGSESSSGGGSSTGSTEGPSSGTSDTSPSETSESSSSGSGDNANPAIVSSRNKGPPIAAIVGGILGALIIILALVVLGMCIRRRRKSRKSPVVPFTEVGPSPRQPVAARVSSAVDVESNPEGSTAGTGMPPSRAWAVDTKVPVSPSTTTSPTMPTANIPDSGASSYPTGTSRRISFLSMFSSHTTRTALSTATNTAAPGYPGPPPPAYSG
ncbi:hypothetical protein MKEN_00183100 [Mycena kentingensis (nom. inval.)]|nr:hypothetical protein MKEN_00183100 [Mycena kentingensis (nom. inval.)]